MTRRRAEYCGNPHGFLNRIAESRPHAGPDLGKTWGYLQIFSGQPHLFGVVEIHSHEYGDHGATQFSNGLGQPLGPSVLRWHFTPFRLHC